MPTTHEQDRICILSALVTFISTASHLLLLAPALLAKLIANGELIKLCVNLRAIDISIVHYIALVVPVLVSGTVVCQLCTNVYVMCGCLGVASFALGPVEIRSCWRGSPTRAAPRHAA